MTWADFSTALQGNNEIDITVTGRTSSRSLTFPVWFVLEGDKLFLVPVKGPDTNWYKNVLKTPTIHLTTRGKTFTANVTPITDKVQVDEIVQKLRDKYGAGQVKAYYPRHDVAVEVPLM